MRDDRVFLRWSIALSLQLILAVAATYFILNATEHVLAGLLIEADKIENGVIVRQSASFLRQTLIIGIIGTALIPFVLSTIWVIVASHVSIDGPGRALRYGRTWWGLANIGLLAVAGFGVQLLWFTMLQGLLDEDLKDGIAHMAELNRALLIVGMLLYFWASYHAVGTLLTTPRILAPAVPLATFFRH